MTPAARIQSAIEVLAGLDETRLPADRFLRDWFRARRYAGSKDRAAVAQIVYDVLRHKASLAWRMGREDARSLVIGSLLSENHSAGDITKLFAGEGYGPAPLSEDEHWAIGAQTPDPPAYIRGEYPAWLEPELTCSLGDALQAEMQAMFGRAPVDLRVNRLRAEREETLVGLRSLGIKAEPTPFAPHGIRIPSADGLGALQHTRFFQTGAFEFQDEASQIAALLCAAKPGMRVLDLAAGAGGKALAMAADMENKGEILALDIDAARLKQIEPRARRAGATIIKATDKRGGPLWGNGKFDLVLVDAPCSGSGAWRRNPETKWRLTPDTLRELNELQAWLIDDGARHAKVGARLVYATCSVLACENEDVIEAFLARNTAFKAIPASEIWRSVTGCETPATLQYYFKASPLKTGTDGFFACIMTRLG
jgi:16S rRNA (cytosine967-C5)-methyltransferase